MECRETGKKICFDLEVRKKCPGTNTYWLIKTMSLWSAPALPMINLNEGKPEERHDLTYHLDIFPIRHWRSSTAWPSLSFNPHPLLPLTHVPGSSPLLTPPPLLTYPSISSPLSNIPSFLHHVPHKALPWWWNSHCLFQSSMMSSFSTTRDVYSDHVSTLGIFYLISPNRFTEHSLCVTLF